MMDENDWRRLTRYIAGEGTDDERRTTAQWIAEVPARAELADLLRTGWERAAAPGAPFHVEQAWGEVVRRKAARSAPEPVRAGTTSGPARPWSLEVNRRPPSRRWWSMAVAASLAFMIVGGTAWVAIASFGPGSGAEAGPMRTVSTQPGQTAEVYLSDGTHVRLGAASTLRFPTAFGRQRHVFLEGEGYFDVVHDSEREFAVYTAEAVARDIGTRFNVRSHPGGAATEVMVAEGAVALKPGAGPADSEVAADSVILVQSDLGRVDTAGALAVARGVDVEAYLAWMDGRLVFTDVPLAEVLPQLSRWYGVEITIDDSALAGVRLTATFEIASLPEALRRLSVLLDARVERHEGIITLHAK